jgi:chromate reductase, NAD(P)H dehydrogenase (quinone)
LSPGVPALHAGVPLGPDLDERNPRHRFPSEISRETRNAAYRGDCSDVSVAYPRRDVTQIMAFRTISSAPAVGLGVTVVLLISGSTRSASTNSAALRTVAALAPDGIETPWYDGLAELPAFNPDDDGAAHPSVVALHEQISRADAVLLCTPEYAGTLPGSFKNLLDWTVGTADLHEKPTAFLNVAAPGRGEGAVATLTAVLGYLGAQIEPHACARLPVASDAVGPDGLVTSVEFQTGALDALTRLAGVISA